MAFTSNRDGDWDIHVMDSDGSGVRQLTDSPGLDDKPQWSPDGSSIAFATTRNGRPELMAVDPDTGAEETLLPQPKGGVNPAWSVGFDIAVIDSDGSNQRTVIAESASEERPRWSPDGRYLTYYSDAGESWDVYTVDITSGAARALTDHPGFDGQPAWQPVAR